MLIVASQLAAEYGVPFMETSAKSNINVEDAFVSMAKSIKKKIDEKVVTPPKNGGAKSGGGPVIRDVGAAQKKPGFMAGLCSIL